MQITAARPQVDAQRPPIVLEDTGAQIRSLHLAAGIGVVALAFVVQALVIETGGNPNPVNHLGYIPIVLAAYLWGVRGSAPVAVLVGLLLGPILSVADPAHADTLTQSIVRAGMFILVAVVVGLLFDRSRFLAARWKTTLVDVVEHQRDGMLALARAAEAKDPTTGAHMYRCRDLAALLATEAAMDEATVNSIAWSAMLHDIGKLYVPDKVLVKPGALDPEEFELLKLHPGKGADLLEGGRSFEMARKIARWHHENLDGSGYPDGLKGDKIPIEARIVRVVDSWDAMVNDRPYRKGLSRGIAMEELERLAGVHYDPELVALFIRIMERDTQAQLMRHI